MKSSYEDLLEFYISQVIDDEEEGDTCEVIPGTPTINPERASLFALLMIASYLDSIDTRLLNMVNHVTQGDTP